MHFSYGLTVSLLQRTPFVLEAQLQSLAPEWTLNNEGGDSWSPKEVLGHLIYCDIHNWTKRTDHLVCEGKNSFLPRFEASGQFELYKDKTPNELTEEFKLTRENSLAKLKAMHLSDNDFAKKGLHPEFGEVELSQLLSAWVVHDMSHIAQIVRVMAKQYQRAVGPWTTYLRILK